MNHHVDSELYRELAKYGARDMEICMQCGLCSASCPLSSGTNPFPRKIYRYIQLGLKDKLLKSSEPWLCYYCGDCNKDCPRGAEPAETMMAARRWLTAQYDWTGLARRFYLSEAWEIGALIAVSLGIIVLFCLFHGPVVITEAQAFVLNFLTQKRWRQCGEDRRRWLKHFLLSNAFRMYRFIMRDTKVPFWL